MTLTSTTRQANWRRQHPGRYQAHLAVQRALKAGDLVKMPCEVCGAEKVDAHHDDYGQPLAVQWLCRKHHTILHKRGPEWPNSPQLDLTP